MRLRKLGNTGLQVSEVGIGCAVFGVRNYLEPWVGANEMDRKAAAVIDRAVELGYNYIDTAPGYGDCEERLGRVLAGHRDRFVLATKISPEDWSETGVRRSVEASLRRIRTDAIDVIQFHGGSLLEHEERAILESDALEVIDELRREGKIRFCGFTAESPSGGAQRLLESGRFDVMQIQYSIMYQGAHDMEWNAGLIPMADSMNVGIVTMRTMTSGRLQRLAAHSIPELPPTRVNEIALRYVLSNELVDVALVGMTTPQQVEMNARISEGASENFDLPWVHDPHR